MTVKIALLKSGEQVICDLKEMVTTVEESGDEKVIGYFFEFPYIIRLRNPELVLDKDSPIQLEISMFSWLPLSKDHVIPVTPNWVVTIFEPTKKVKDMYTSVLERIKKGKENSQKNGDQNDKVDSADEQTDSDKQD
jgi:hypothetical protein